MPKLRRHRRDRRARAPKRRKRRNLEKFIPSGDSDFAMTARNFALHVHEHHEECGIDPVQSEYLVRLVTRFREALAVAQNRTTRTPSAIDHKSETRKEAEAQVRMIGAKIRTDPTVDRSHKVILRLARPSRTRKGAMCPHRPPVLLFEGSSDGTSGSAGFGNGRGMHVLKFRDMQTDITKSDCGVMRKARPDGAARIELFIGFVPQGAPIPRAIGEYVRAGHGWPLYLRSHNTSPIEVEFPMPSQPMLIVYWARWADTLGNVGRFCKTCAARVEGWSEAAHPPGAALPEGMGEGRCEFRSDARFFLAEREVRERYLEGGGALPLPLPAGRKAFAEEVSREIPGEIPGARLLDAA